MCIAPEQLSGAGIEVIYGGGENDGQWESERDNDVDQKEDDQEWDEVKHATDGINGLHRVVEVTLSWGKKYLSRSLDEVSYWTFKEYCEISDLLKST